MGTQEQEILREILEVVREIRDSIQDVPAHPVQPWVPGQDYYLSNQCSKCGMVFEGATGYCCTQLECPMGIGSVQA